MPELFQLCLLAIELVTFNALYGKRGFATVMYRDLKQRAKKGTFGCISVVVAIAAKSTDRWTDRSELLVPVAAQSKILLEFDNIKKERKFIFKDHFGNEMVFFFFYQNPFYFPSQNCQLGKLMSDVPALY